MKDFKTQAYRTLALRIYVLFMFFKELRYHIPGVHPDTRTGKYSPLKEVIGNTGMFIKCFTKQVKSDYFCNFFIYQIFI